MLSQRHLKSPCYKQLAEVFKEQMSEAGINMTIDHNVLDGSSIAAGASTWRST